MAKKTKPAEGENTATETTTAPTPEKGTNDRFTRVYVDGNPAPSLKEDGSAKKLAPQAQVIVDTIAEFGTEGVTRKDLVAKLEADGKLKTKQPVGRILSYYQKDIVKFGTVTHVKA